MGCWDIVESPSALIAAFSSFYFWFRCFSSIQKILRGSQVGGDDWPIKQCEKMVSERFGISFGTQSVSTGGSMKCSEVSMQMAVLTLDLTKQSRSTTTNSNRWNLKSSQIPKRHTGLQKPWIEPLPTESRTLISKWNEEFTLIWKEYFKPLTDAPLLFFSVAQVRRIWCNSTCFWFRMASYKWQL